MLLSNGDGTYVAGPLDVIVMLYHEQAQRFHVAFFEEHPFPGPVRSREEVTLVRLKSRMHHTGGSQNWLEAQGQLEELTKKIGVVERNVLRESFLVWDGYPALVVVCENWLQTDGGPQIPGLVKVAAANLSSGAI